MYLHNDDRELFKDLINYVSEKSNVREEIIEKDYYVTLILYELSKIEYPLVFKGGTSLSKAYGVINRFSEDIDVAFTEHLGESKRKKLKYNVLKPIGEKIGLNISNWNNIESDKDLNQYVYAYKSVSNDADITSNVIVETSLMSNAFPFNVCEVSNYMYECLKNTHHKLLEKNSLLPFNMRVQTIERTFIDKIFALSDYYLLNRPKKHARHLYDLYKLKDKVVIDEKFLDLLEAVRKERVLLGDKIAPSANFDVDIINIASLICDFDFYKKDYEETTVFMISEHIDYQTVSSNYLNLVKRIFIK